MKATTIYISLLFLKLSFMPDAGLLAWVFIAMLADLVTGIIKSKMLKTPITSTGMRKSVVKALQYMGLIIAGVILGNTMKENNEVIRWINDGMLIFIIYVEVYSILENLYAMNPESPVSKNIFKPLLSFLALSISKNPFSKINNNTGSNNNLTVIVLLLVSISFASCKIVNPGIDSSYEKSDTTSTNYKPVNVDVKGATVSNTLNVDSIVAAIAYKIKATQPTVNMDSLIATIKANLSYSNKPVSVTDKDGKVELKYWLDEFGKLQITCSSKDQTIQLLVAEITKLSKEKRTEARTEVDYRMPWWGWLILGASAIMFVIGLIKSR